MLGPGRLAQFVVEIPEAEAPTLGDIQDRSGAITVSAEGEMVRYLCATGFSDMPAETHLDQLWSDSSLLRAALESVPEGSVESALRVIQYVPSDEPSGFGVPFSAEWVRAVGDLNGFIEVDQYLWGTD